MAAVETAPQTREPAALATAAQSPARSRSASAASATHRDCSAARKIRRDQSAIETPPRPRRPQPQRNESLAAGAADASATFATVASLQARVEQRAMRLQRDVATLVARKRSLLQQEVEEEVAREAAGHAERGRCELRKELAEATAGVTAELEEARADQLAVMEEIDSHLVVLDQVRSAATAQLDELEHIRSDCMEALMLWVGEARKTQQQRLEHRTASDIRWVRENVAVLMPAVVPCVVPGTAATEASR